MEGAQVPPQQVVYVQQAPMLNAKSSGLAIVLAFLWPGLNYFYLEMVRVESKEQLGFLS